MAKEIPSVGDLRRKSEVSDDEIAEATAAYLKDENADLCGLTWMSGLAGTRLLMVR